jgi:mannose-6-phosphate isomerase-like protein (cupin superfamily)
VPLLILWLGYEERPATGISLVAIVVIASIATSAQPVPVHVCGGPGSAPRTSIYGMSEPVGGGGYTVSTLDQMGDGYGFRKIRQALGVTAFGINALVLPPGYQTGVHYHDQQEETYFVHRGQVEFRFGDETTHLLGPGGAVRVSASTHRGMRNAGQDDAIVVVVGGKDGYVGRDGRPGGDQGSTTGAPGAPPAQAAPGPG